MLQCWQQGLPMSVCRITENFVWHVSSCVQAQSSWAMCHSVPLNTFQVNSHTWLQHVEDKIELLDEDAADVVRH